MYRAINLLQSNLNHSSAPVLHGRGEAFRALDEDILAYDRRVVMGWGGGGGGGGGARFGGERRGGG